MVSDLSIKTNKLEGELEEHEQATYYLIQHADKVQALKSQGLSNEDIQEIIYNEMFPEDGEKPDLEPEPEEPESEPEDNGEEETEEEGDPGNSSEGKTTREEIVENWDDYYQLKSFSQIAEELDISKGRVSQIVKEEGLKEDV